MPRPSRTWVRKTYTVSPEVSKAIAARAAEQDIDPGTVMDVIVWNAILKPDAARLKRGGFSEEELERIFAEEVLEFLREPGSQEQLIERLPPESDLGNEHENLRLVRLWIKRWRKTRLIEKEFQEAIFWAMNDAGQVPSILGPGLVDANWFIAE